MLAFCNSSQCFGLLPVFKFLDWMPRVSKRDSCGFVLIDQLYDEVFRGGVNSGASVEHHLVH